MKSKCKNEACVFFVEHKSDGCEVDDGDPAEECHKFSSEPISKKWFNKGQESVLRDNPSGCCCKFDEDGETVLSPCLAHERWRDKAIKSFQREKCELRNWCDVMSHQECPIDCDHFSAKQRVVHKIQNKEMDYES